MIAVDSNVLVYAHRSEFAQHARAAEQLRALAEGEAPWGLPVFCLAEFVRVVTHRRVLSPPSSLASALDAIDRLAESPSLRLLSPGPRFPAIFRQASESADAKGNLAFNAQIAAVCIEHGATALLTADRDFRRFSSLTVTLL